MNNQNRKEAMTKSAAQFESSFTGLDLSEFSSEAASTSTGTSTGTSTRQSASAQLMEVMKREAFHKRQNEEEESMIHYKASIKAQNALKRLDNDRAEKAKSDREHNVLHSALLSMHGNDISGAKKAKNGAKTKAQRKMAMGINVTRERTGRGTTKTKTKTKSGKGIHKKSKRSKFY